MIVGFNHMPLAERQAINSANASRQGRNAFWTAARVTALAQKCGEGKSARIIADEIGDGCTRNMVIGKCKRQKIILPGPRPNKERAKARREAKEARRLAKVERYRNEVARLLGALIELEKRAPSRVSRETSQPETVKQSA